MTARALTGLLAAGGVATPGPGYSFRQSMRGGPLPNGRRMRNYLYTGLEIVTCNDAEFSGRTSVQYAAELQHAVDVAPDRLDDLAPHEFAVYATDYYNMSGNPQDPSGPIDIETTSLVYDAAQRRIRWEGTATNGRRVERYTNEIVGPDTDRYTLAFRFRPDAAFNAPLIASRPNQYLRAQETPGDPGPQHPAPYQEIFPSSSGDGYVEIRVTMEWFGFDLAANGAIEWAADPGFTEPLGGGGSLFLPTAPGTVITAYARARGSSEFTAPYSYNQTTWADPR